MFFFETLLTPVAFAHAPTDARTQQPETILESNRGHEEARRIETRDRTELSSLEASSKEQFSCSLKRMKDAKNFSLEDDEGWKKELETKNRRIAELEDQLTICKSAKNSDNESLMDEEKESWRKEVRARDDRISQLEGEMGSLRRLIKEYKRSEEKEARVRDNDNESWKLEVEAKNRRIVELEQEMESLENFLREHADTESVRDMEIVIERKARRIEELEDTVAEFEDFLKQNPDVKELHDLRCQVTAGNRRIQELERWIQKNDESRESRIDRERVIELEEMVTQLEEYVREHNVDVLKRKLEDRECRIDQLQNRVGHLEKELLKVEEAHRGKIVSKSSTIELITFVFFQFLVKKKQFKFQSNDYEKNSNFLGKETQGKSNEKETRTEDSLSGQMVEKNFEKEQKMKKMEHAISEKDNKIQEYEQQILESKEEITKLRKEVANLKKELSEYDDIGVLKEEIRVRDEKIQQLEDEVDSLERAFSERIDLEQIEELVNVIKEKEDKERQLSKDLTEKRYKIEELGEALRESVVITSESERKLKNEEKLREEALQRVKKNAFDRFEF